MDDYLFVSSERQIMCTKKLNFSIMKSFAILLVKGLLNATISGYHLVKLQEPFKITDPCKACFIQPQATLNQWQLELNWTSLAAKIYATEFKLLASSET